MKRADFHPVFWQWLCHLYWKQISPVLIEPLLQTKSNHILFNLSKVQITCQHIEFLTSGKELIYPLAILNLCQCIQTEQVPIEDQEPAACLWDNITGRRHPPRAPLPKAAPRLAGSFPVQTRNRCIGFPMKPLAINQQKRFKSGIMTYMCRYRRIALSGEKPASHIRALSDLTCWFLLMEWRCRIVYIKKHRNVSPPRINPLSLYIYTPG